MATNSGSLRGCGGESSRLSSPHPRAIICFSLFSTALLNLNEVEKQWRLNQLNNAATTLIFITVMINIFITAFGAHTIGLLAAGTPL